MISGQTECVTKCVTECAFQKMAPMHFRKDEMLDLLVRAFHLSCNVPALSRLRSECLHLLGHTEALSRIQSSDIDKSSIDRMHYIMRMPLKVIKELLESDDLEVPEELLLLTVWRYLLFQSKQLSKYFIRDFVNVKLPAPDADDDDRGISSSPNSSPITPTPLIPTCLGPNSHTLSTPVPIFGLSPTTGEPSTTKVELRKRRMSPSSTPSRAVVKSRFGFRRFNSDEPSDEKSASTQASDEKSTPAHASDEKSTPVPSNSTQQHHIIPSFEISFKDLCNFLELPPRFFVCLFSNLDLEVSSLQSALEFTALVLLYRSLEPGLRYVLIASERLAAADLEVVDAALLKEAALWHLSNIRKSPQMERLVCSYDPLEDEDSDNTDVEEKVEQLRKSLLKMRKTVSLRRLRGMILRLHFLMGFCPKLSDPLSQSCSPRKVPPFGWRINESRLKLRGGFQIVVRGETPPPPLDWSPAVSDREYRYGNN